MFLDLFSVLALLFFLAEFITCRSLFSVLALLFYLTEFITLRRFFFCFSGRIISSHVSFSVAKEMTDESHPFNLSTSLLEKHLNDTFSELASMASQQRAPSVTVISTVASFLQMYMGRVNASSTLFGALTPYSCDFTDSLLSPVNVSDLGYVSSDVALEMASKAQQENVNILLKRTGDFSELQKNVFIGMGCTAAIRSEKPKKGPHRAFVALKIGTKTFALHLEMNKGVRERKMEDEVVSYLMVMALQKALSLSLLPTELFLHSDEKIDVVSETENNPLDLLLLGDVESVLFTGTDFVGTNVSLPPGSLVYPGSYNPIHEGHVSLAQVSQQKFVYMDKEGNAKLPPLVFEISVWNVDKPPITKEECLCRLEMIREMCLVKGLQNVAVMFTRAPKFADKSRILKDCMFIVGMDTMERILNPTYYETDKVVLSVIIEIVAENKCSFVVGGRHNKEGEFVTLTTEFLIEKLGFLPWHLFPSRLSFVALTEDEFCINMSSTEIRSKRIKMEGGAN